MTEQVFIDLGFERYDEKEGDFYYYTLDIGDICFISNANDEAQESGWECSIFDSMTLRIVGAGDLQELVKIVKLNTHD